MNPSELLYTIFWIGFYLFILFLFIVIIFSISASAARKRHEKMEEYDVTFLSVKLPSENEVEITAAEQMFAGLIGFKKSFLKALFTGQHRISFEIVSKSEGIGF
jgi:hypothetical protein